MSKLNQIELQSRDILQINATIIAGLLIFLTLFGTATNLKNYTALPFALVISLVILIFFSLSSLFTIIGIKKLAVEFMKVGFIVILIFAFLLLSLDSIREARNEIAHFFGIKNSTNQTAINQAIVNQTSP